MEIDAGRGHQTCRSLFYLQAAAPAALQNVRNAPRIVCAKAEKGQKLRPRSVAAASEDMRLPMNQV